MQDSTENIKFMNYSSYAATQNIIKV